MTESLEPHRSSGQQIAGLLLRVVLLAIVALAIIAAVYYKSDGSSISTAQLREVLDRVREKRRERMIEEVEKMRQVQAEMQVIRDRNLAKAGVEGDPTERLPDQERQMREKAARPVENLSFDEVFDTARAVEQDVITLYNEFLAARQMAMGQGLTYEDAFTRSGIQRLTRTSLDTKALYRDIVTTDDNGGLPEFRAQIKLSNTEMREMLENCDKLLEFTRGSEKTPPGGYQYQLAEGDRAVKDYRGPELMPDDLDTTSQHDPGNFDAVPGRRLDSSGEWKEWVYVDTWYIIGPFPIDARRENLDVQFGPEANVNLDDVFVGKDDRKVRWVFTQVPYAARNEQGQSNAVWKIEPRVVQGKEIYYAFTEVYSDAPREVWIATGTDDYGKLWINDELVWTSPKNKKPYNATENLQKVKLRQGQNKVLYRVENAGGTMGFSLLINLMPT